MIVTGDVGIILLNECKRFGLPVFRKGALTNKKIERIVILPKKQEVGKIWRKGFVEVNFIVPNREDGRANLVRLTELEKLAFTLEGTGFYNGSRYLFDVESTSQEEDAPLDSFFVNCRILFEVLNVK